MAVKAGFQSLTVGGAEFDVDPESIKWSVDVREEESIVGSSGAIGSTSKGVAPFIEAKVYLDQSQSVSQVKAVGDEPVILVLLDRTVTLTEARFVGRAEVESTNSLTVRYEGRAGQSILI